MMNDIKITPLLDTLRLQKIDDAEYFSKKYSNYISNSRLGLINPEQDGSFERFVEGFKPMYSAAFDLGSGCHMLTLQSHLFEVCHDVDKPTAKMGALADRLYSIYKEKGEVTDEQIVKEATIIDYYGGLLTEKRLTDVREKCEPYWSSRKQFEESYSGEKELLFFDPKSRETVLNCVDALSKNSRVQKLLHPVDILGNPIISECEQAILLDIKVEVDGYDPFILKLKSKLDNYTIDKDNNEICVNDVKTIGKIVSEAMSNIQKFRYNRELSMYSWLLKLCAEKFYGLESPTVKGNYLFVSTIPGHYTKVIPMTRDMYKEGWNEFKNLVKLVAQNVAEQHHEFGVWD